MPAFLTIISVLLNRGEEITADAVKLYADVAHGEGGLQKVKAAVDDLAKTVGDAIGAAQAATTATK